MDIVLYPWWNVASTPARLSSLTFEWGTNLNAYYMSWGKWISTTLSNTSLMEPLQGYLIRNNSNQNITMKLGFKPYDWNPMDYLLSKNVYAWWNFLWISTTNAPFSSLTNTNWTIYIDFTHAAWEAWERRYTNRVAWSPLTFLYFTSPSEFEIWEAYAVFLNNNWTYWGYNNTNADYDPNSDVCNDPAVTLACALDSISCPFECMDYDVWILGSSANNTSAIYWETGIYIWGESIKVRNPIKMSFKIKARSTTTAIDSMYVKIWDVKYVWTKSIKWVDTEFSFSNLVVTNSNQDFKVFVDIHDDSSLVWQTINFSPIIDKDIFDSITYLDTDGNVGNDKIRWSFELWNVFIQSPVITEDNSRAPDWIEFYVDETDENDVLYMKYSTSNWDAYINSAYISWSQFSDTNEISLHLYVWWEDLWKIEIWEDNKLSFPDIKVWNWQYVYIRIVARIDWYEEKIYNDLKLHIGGHDIAWHAVREVAADIHPVKVLVKDITISSANWMNTLLLKEDNSRLATLDFETNVQVNSLNELTLAFSWQTISANDIKLVKDYNTIIESEITSASESNWNIKYLLNWWMDTLDVILKNWLTWDIELKVVSINNKPKNIVVWKTKYVNTLMQFTYMKDYDDYTEFKIKVSWQDTPYSYIKDLEIRAWETQLDIQSVNEVVNYSSIELGNNIPVIVNKDDDNHTIDKIVYTIVYEWGDEEIIEINKNEFPEYFKVWNNPLRTLQEKH